MNALLILLTTLAALGDATARPLDRPQRAVVKLYGAGGVAGLEGYQTGVFVDSAGLVLTVDSPVIQDGAATVVDAFGDRCEARLVGRDAATGLALLACPEQVTPPAVVDLTEAIDPKRTQRVWVLSNAFNIAVGDEPVSVQRARIAVAAPIPLALEGARSRPLVGVPAAGARVLLLDAVTSNPGAGGGLAVDADGTPVGVIGAECRSPVTGAWINYALPARAAAEAVERMRRGGDEMSLSGADVLIAWREPLWRAGLVLTPTIVERTPAYVEAVAPDSVAAASGLRADDLVVAVDGATVATAEAAGRAIARRLADGSPVAVTVLRDERLETFTLTRDAP